MGERGMSRRYVRRTDDLPAGVEPGDAYTAGPPVAWQTVVRGVVGFLGALALISIGIWTETRATDSDSSQTIMQQIGYYVQGAFYAVIVRGIGVLAYNATRTNE